MNEPQVRLLFCEHYRPEIEFLKAAGEFDGVSFSFFNGMCGRPSIRWDQLEEAAGVVADPERLKIVGGCCLQLSEPAPARLSAAKVTRFNSCFELIADETQLADVRPGDYAVVPGWLGTWQDMMAVWEFDKDTAREFFTKSSDSFLLLDTGTHPDSLNRLEEFSDFVGLPYRVVDIGIRTFRARLRSIVGIVNSTSESEYSEGHNMQNPLADYAMVLDLMHQVVSKPNLAATVAVIAEVFNLMTAAAGIEIIYKDHTGLEKKFAWGDRLPESTNFTLQPSSIDPLPSGKGFLLPLVHADEKVGFVRVDGIPMADAIDHYMNFALAIADVCALAIKSKVDQERYAQEKNRSLMQFLDSTRAAPYEFNFDAGRFVFVGNQMERITGYPPDYWTDLKSWADTIIDDDREWAVNFCLNKTMSGEEHDFVYRMRAKDGSVLWISDVVSVVMGETGPEKLIGFIHDITARKRAEEERQATEIRYKELFSNMTEAFAIHEVVLDESGTVVDYKFLDVNPAFESETGLKKDDLIGKSVREILPDEDPSWIETYGKVAMGGAPVHLIHYSPALKKHYEVFAYRPEFKRFAVLFRDVTAKLEIEEKFRQASKMEAIGTLAGGVAHDFNNMLGVILGHTEMALEETDPASPLYADLQSVHQAGERSADLTRQLLTFARKQTIAPRIIDINDTVEGILNMLRRLIGEDIDLVWQPGINLQPVKIDPSQIDQLLVNLCVNARDAIDGVGKVTIETDAKTFDEDHCTDHLESLPGEYVLLEVSDDGCGMDKKTLSHIFEPFFTTKEQGKGTGLGLASIYGIVKQNNGFINVYSEPDQGTTFKIYLPVYAIKSDGVVEKAPDLPAEHGDETILLVEDEPAILNMTTRMLTRLGYTVVAAATPGEAIRLAHEYRGRIGLLMTDVVMPEMNGRELAGNLLSHYPDLKRLFMSGYTANVIAHHGVLDEGAHFIQKPFSKKDLGEKVREALEG